MNAIVKPENQHMAPVQQEDGPITALAKLAAGGASLEVIEQMKGLVEWDEARRAKAEFNKAFSMAKAMFRSAKKTGHNTHLKSHYSTLLDYDEATRDGLSANGLSWRHVPKSLPNDITSITCILAHKGGHSEEATMEAPSYSMTNNAVNKLQSVGIVATYLKRMTLCSLLGLVSDSEFDNDGNGGKGQETISEHDAANLKALADEVNAKIPDFLKFFKIERLEQMPKDRMKQATQMLEAKRKKK
jgi:hypothetical protein